MPFPKATVSGIITAFLLLGNPAAASVLRVEVLERAPILDGKRFGAVGPYERIKGRVFSKSIPNFRPIESYPTLTWGRRMPADAWNSLPTAI